jgi:hypothetical protein
VARFRFSLPPAEKLGELSKFVEMSLYFVDRLAEGVKISQQVGTIWFPPCDVRT